jgi:hypothetical protein
MLYLHNRTHYDFFVFFFIRSFVFSLISLIIELLTNLHSKRLMDFLLIILLVSNYIENVFILLLNFKNMTEDDAEAFQWVS